MWSGRQESNLLSLAPKASRLPFAITPMVPRVGIEPTIVLVLQTSALPF